MILSAFACGGVAYWALTSQGDLIASSIAVSVVAAVLWITEALPLTVTALLIPVALAAVGVFTESQAFLSFGNPVLFLILGGYGLGAAVAANGVDNWIARTVLMWAGRRTINVVIALSLTSAVLSMFLSNTATTALLLPVAIGISSRQSDDPNLAIVLLLSVAYGASIGGAATIVGSPPNALVAGMLDIGFLQWMSFGVPASLLMLLCAIPILWFSYRPGHQIPSMEDTNRIGLSAGGNRTVVVIALVILMWLFGPILARMVGLPAALFSPAAVACMAIAVLAVTRCIDWNTLERSVQWGVLLLLGGGLTLGRGLTESGAADWLGDLLVSGFGHLPLLGLLFLFVAISVFTTELISNTAITAKLAPIMVGVALQLGLAAESLVVPVAIASSMAFMLPVATPPNAMVHATGRVSQKQMMRVGMLMNIAAIVVISLLFSRLL